MSKEKLEQLLKNLERENSLSNLCTILGESEYTILGEIAKLKSKGKNITDVKKFGEIYITNHGDNNLENSTPYVIETNDDVLKMAFISDTRLCSKFQQLTILNDIYKKANEFGANIFLHCGDISEGVYSGKKELYMSTLFAHDVFSQSSYITNNYPYIKNANTYFITGEHDHSHLKHSKKESGSSIDIGRIISEDREDMIYLGKNRREIKFVNENGTQLFNLLMQHPKGKIPYTISYKPQQFISAIRSEDKTNFLLHGHWLQTERLMFREIEEYSIPSVVATTPEMVDNGDQNTIGAWFVEIEFDSRNLIKKVTPTFIPYYKTLDDDYKNVKTLSIGGK